jgi:hypothetical protein
MLQCEDFVPVVDHRHDDSVSDEESQKDADLSRLQSRVESPRATCSNVAASSNMFATLYGISCVQEGVMSHQIHVARSDEVIWISLECKNIHEFYQ